MNKLKLLLGIIVVSVQVPTTAHAVDMGYWQTLALAARNAEHGGQAYNRGIETAIEQHAKMREAKMQMMDMAIKEAQFRRWQQMQMESHQQQRESCEVGCQTMYNSGQLKAGHTVESCVAILCR